MGSFKNGLVVICATSQAGTVIQITGKEVWVLLRNNDVWVGTDHDIRLPQDQADLDACPIDVGRLEQKKSPRLDYEE
jgi:hypothetical protein